MRQNILQSLRSPLMPSVLEELLFFDTYSNKVLKNIFLSVNTNGFINNALYINDMSLKPLEDVIDFGSHNDFFKKNNSNDRDQIIKILDIFTYLQPQILLILAALLESFHNDFVGGKGDNLMRKDLNEEILNKNYKLSFCKKDTFDLLESFKTVFKSTIIPDLYLSLSNYNEYLDYAWLQLQHLSSFPEVRQRSRGLYYYAVSSSKFLAYPFYGSIDRCLSLGINKIDLEKIEVIVKENLSMYSSMIMHCSAMRIGLGLNQKKVVKG